MSIGRDSLAYWISQASNSLISFATSIVVARVLDVERRGLFVAILFASFLLVSLTNLGLQALAMYFTGKRREQLSTLHTLIVLIVLAVAIGDFALVALFGEPLRARYDQLRDIPWRYLLPAILVLPFSLYFYAAQGVLTGLGRVRDLARFLLGFAVVTNLANVALLALAWLGFWPWTIAGLIAIWTASQVGAALWTFAMIRRAGCRWTLAGGAETMRGLAEMLSYGLRAFAGNFATSLVNRMDHVAITLTAGTPGYGVYQLSSKLAELIYQPSAALERAGFARVAGSSPAESARLIQDLFRMNFLINGCAVVIFMLAAWPFVALVYGSQYLGVALPLQILLPGTLALSLARIMALYFSGQLGKPQIPSAIAWLTLGLNAPLMWWIVGQRGMGFAGAAAVTSGSYVFMLAAYLVIFSTQTGLYRPADYFIPQRRDLERVRNLIASLRRRD